MRTRAAPITNVYLRIYGGTSEKVVDNTREMDRDRERENTRALFLDINQIIIINEQENGVERKTE